MHLKTILAALQEIAPLAYAESWDNVGLLTGDPGQEIRRIFLTIDYTPDVADEARNLNCDLIIAYHPPLFAAVKRITTDGPSSLIYDAIRRGVAIYSPHTAWDVADGGTNDLLADALGLAQRLPLRMITPADADLKLVTFVPESHLDAVSRALFAAGAGQIGNYSCCSFRAAGVGTFFGEPGAHPAVGQAGRLENAPEFRLETILPRPMVQAVLAALRKSHPYEEPAIDLTVLAAPPTGAGQGRIGELPEALPVAELVLRLKRELQLAALLVGGQEDRSVRRIAVCAGAGGELLDNALARGAELFVTGELRHHDALKAARGGVTTICTLHSNSERPSLMRLKSRLENALPDLPEALISQKDRDPFVVR